MEKVTAAAGEGNFGRSCDSPADELDGIGWANKMGECYEMEWMEPSRRRPE
jgi:hypothetical protein